MRTTLLTLCLLASPAAAQTTWAVPDGGGGFTLYVNPNGIGTATPDGGGGFIVRQPESWATPRFVEPTPADRGAGLPHQPHGHGGEARDHRPGQGVNTLVLRCPALQWTIPLRPDSNVASILSDMSRKPISYEFHSTEADFQLGLLTTIEGAPVLTRVDIDRRTLAARIGQQINGVWGPNVVPDQCRVVG
jgi:hypothetical protein